MFLLLAMVAIYGGDAIAEIKHLSGGSDYCIVDGRPYRSGDRIPRTHPCHVCLCQNGKAECAWMNCPSPPEGCSEYTVPKYCNPALYVCSIPRHLQEDTRRKRNLRRRRESDMIAASLETSRRVAPGDCTVLGVKYNTGDLMGIATSFCLECRCGRRNMLCSPRCCFGYASLHENTTAREWTERLRRLPPQMHPLQHLLN